MLNIETKAGNNRKVAGKWNISLLSSKLFLEGPIPKGSWILALRRTYLDKLAELVGTTEKLPYYFYDLHTKVSFDPTAYDRISLSGFLSRDVIAPSKVRPGAAGGGDLYWANHALAIKWQRIVNPKLFSTTLFVKSGYRARFVYGRGGMELPNYADNEIDDIGITTDFTYFASQQHSIKFGIGLKSLKFNNTLIPTPVDTALSYHNLSYYSAFYLQDERQVRIRKRTPIVISAGVRFSHFSSGNYFRLSPRIGIKYLISDDLAVKAAWGHYYQFFSIPSFGDELLERNFVAVTCLPWYSADKNLKPAYGTHYILGIEKWISSNENLSIEAYHKNMHNVLEIRSFPAEEKFVSKGIGYARGLELLYKKKNNFISYAYSVTKREFDGVSFYPAHDCRHRLNLAWNFPLLKKWSLSIRWIYNTGLPYTGVIGYYQYVEFVSEIEGLPFDKDLYWESISGRRGNFRLPTYHRLDVSLAREFKVFSVNLTAYVQIINLYNRKNYSYIYYDYSKNPPKIVGGDPMLPRLPSIGIMGEF